MGSPGWWQLSSPAACLPTSPTASLIPLVASLSSSTPPHHSPCSSHSLMLANPAACLPISPTAPPTPSWPSYPVACLPIAPTASLIHPRTPPPSPMADSQPHGNSLLNMMLPLNTDSLCCGVCQLLDAGAAPSWPRNVSSLPRGFPHPAPFYFRELVSPGRHLSLLSVVSVALSGPASQASPRRVLRCLLFCFLYEERGQWSVLRNQTDYHRYIPLGCQTQVLKFPQIQSFCCEEGFS